MDAISEPSLRDNTCAAWPEVMWDSDEMLKKMLRTLGSMSKLISMLSDQEQMQKYVADSRGRGVDVHLRGLAKMRDDTRGEDQVIALLRKTLRASDRARADDLLQDVQKMMGHITDIRNTVQTAPTSAASAESEVSARLRPVSSLSRGNYQVGCSHERSMRNSPTNTLSSLPENNSRAAITAASARRRGSGVSKRVSAAVTNTASVPATDLDPTSLGDRTVRPTKAPAGSLMNIGAMRHKGVDV